MSFKDNYSTKISLRCMTCGATYAFETDEKTGEITCHKCNRVYKGGYKELVQLNEAFIEEEKERLLSEVGNDIENQFRKIFKI